jgi:HAD superfamily hydrolase (TIGR01484 family)
MDGTILEGGKLIRAELIEALQGLAQRGVHCVTATGRPYLFQVELIEIYQSEGYGIFFDALIADEREIFLREGDGFTPHQPWNDAVRERWTHVFDGAMAMLEEARLEAVSRAFEVDYLFGADVAFERGLPTLFFESAKHAAEIEAWAQAQIRERHLPLASNRYVRIVQVFDGQVGKGPVLAELARMMGVPNHQVLAIGDSTNDYSMLDGNYGFQCATLDNAEDELKFMVRNAGGYVASKASGLGVIETIAHLAGAVAR